MIRADNMLRVGVVSSVNEDKRMARVFYPDQGNMVSDWLYVLQFPTWTKYAKLSPYNTELNMQEAGSHTHTVPDHTHTIDSHTHSIPAHTHSNSVSEVALSAESAGDHTHSIHVSEGSGSADSAGAHTHSIPAHSHTVTINDTSQTTDGTALTTNATGNTTESAGGHSHYLGSHTHLIDDHRHRTGFWMPRINDRVLVLMACGEEKDGYIMGVISSEQFDE